MASEQAVGKIWPSMAVIVEALEECHASGHKSLFALVLRKCGNRINSTEADPFRDRLNRLNLALTEKSTQG